MEMPLLLTCYPLPHPHVFLKLTLKLKYHLPFLKFSNKEDDYGLSALYVLKKVPTKKLYLVLRVLQAQGKCQFFIVSTTLTTIPPSKLTHTVGKFPVT